MQVLEIPTTGSGMVGTPILGDHGLAYGRGGRAIGATTRATSHRVKNRHPRDGLAFIRPPGSDVAGLR
jgi:hypothetical protein